MHTHRHLPSLWLLWPSAIQWLKAVFTHSLATLTVSFLEAKDKCRIWGALRSTERNSRIIFDSICWNLTSLQGSVFAFLFCFCCLVLFNGAFVRGLGIHGCLFILTCGWSSECLSGDSEHCGLPCWVWVVLAGEYLMKYLKIFPLGLVWLSGENLSNLLTEWQITSWVVSGRGKEWERQEGLSILSAYFLNSLVFSASSFSSTRPGVPWPRDLLFHPFQRINLYSFAGAGERCIGI